MIQKSVLEEMVKHYSHVSSELRIAAKQSRVLNDPTGVGTEREEAYKSILERFLPKRCDVFLGGYLFGLNGDRSEQVDIIVTDGNTLRFRMAKGNKHIAPLLGSIAVAEIKSVLDKDRLQDALGKCSSIPPMPRSDKIVSPVLRIPTSRWIDSPYKIIFAYDGINSNTLHNHIVDYYSRNHTIPEERRPNLIHVLGKYVIVRVNESITIMNADGRPAQHQPNIGDFYTLITHPDILAMSWIINEIHRLAVQSHHLLFKFDNWHNVMMNQIQNEPLNS